MVLANVGPTRPIVEHDSLAVLAHSKLPPEIAQVHDKWLRSHLAIEFGQRLSVGRLVANSRSPLKRPFGLDTREGGAYVGTVRIKQTDFGIQPIKVGGGVVKVKDELEIAFRVYTRGTGA
jgi:hypothetical protein